MKTISQARPPNPNKARAIRQRTEGKSDLFLNVIKTAGNPKISGCFCISHLVYCLKWTPKTSLTSDTSIKQSGST